MSQLFYRRLRERFGEPLPTLSRRDVLKAAVAASAGFLLPRGVFGDDAIAKHSGRVILIGAGFSGLSAAYQLLQMGYEVIVVEGRGRVGGRVLTLTNMIPGKLIEGGAELIGSNHPTWNSYASTFGLHLTELPSEDGSAPIELGGKLLSNDEAKSLLSEMEVLFAKLTEAAGGIDPVRPWTSPKAELLDKTSLADWLDAQDASPLCRMAVATSLGGDAGVGSAWQSLLGMLTCIQGGGGQKYWEETERYRCAEGNQALATKLADAVLEKKGQILLSTEVQQVRCDERGVAVMLAEGKTLEADDVVLTAPPTTWNRIRFNPNLPPTLMPQMGTNIKFLVQLRDRVWKKSQRTPNALSDGPITMTWESTSTQPGDQDIGMVCFSGGAAADICRNWPVGERQENYKKILERWYPGIGESFVKAQLMDWPSDRWTKASYSFPAPGQVTTQGPILYDGLGRLHFAGEHTCYAFPGYMEGALQSGARLAQRIAMRDGLVKAAPDNGAPSK